MIWSALRTQVKKRLGLGVGTKHDEQADTAMIAAGELLHSVKWGCIHDTLALTIAPYFTAATAVITDVGVIDANRVIISPNIRVIEGTVESIITSPPTAYGTPHKFIFYDGAFHFGSPTADIDYTATIPYWRKFVEPAEGATPEIVSYLGDALFIAAAVWTFAKYFETEEENKVISSDALNELLLCARAAQSRQSWQGPSLEEIVRQRG